MADEKVSGSRGDGLRGTALNQSRTPRGLLFEIEIKVMGQNRINRGFGTLRGGKSYVLWAEGIIRGEIWSPPNGRLEVFNCHY